MNSTIKNTQGAHCEKACEQKKEKPCVERKGDIDEFIFSGIDNKHVSER